MTNKAYPRPRVLLASQHSNRVFQSQIAAGIAKGGGRLVAIVEECPRDFKSSRVRTLKRRLRRFLIDRYSPRMALRLVFLDEHDRDELALVLKRLRVDLMIVARWGLLSADVLSLPPLGTINTHISLLPELRGPSPVKGAILAGMKQTGVTIHFLDAGIDTGDIISQHSFPILATDTEGSIETRAASVLQEAYAEVMRHFRARNVPRREQGKSTSSYFSWRRCFDFDGASSLEIDWNAPAWFIDRVVRMHSCHILREGEKLAVAGSEIIARVSDVTPGTILDVSRNYLVIQTGAGALRTFVADRDFAGEDDTFGLFNVGDCLSGKIWPGWKQIADWSHHRRLSGMSVE